MQTKLSVTGVGTASNSRPLEGSSRIIQVDAPADGLTTFKVSGSLDGTLWTQLVAPGTADILQSIVAVPYVQLEITAGTGTVTALIG